MKLYDYLRINNESYDAWDTEVDDCICVDLPDDADKDWYSIFCRELYQKVDFVDTSYESIIVDWYGFCKENLVKLRKFANEWWTKNYCEDDDDLICEWIAELGRFVSGYANESIYERFVREVLR